MTDYVHRWVSENVLDRGATSFDLHDRKGRQLGFAWTIVQMNTHVYTDEERASPSYTGGYLFQDADTVRFVGRTSATRAGKRYGASVSSLYGKSLEEVRQAVVKRAAGCEKRYAKLVAKGGI
jgi:hypothetical protein